MPKPLPALSTCTSMMKDVGKPPGRSGKRFNEQAGQLRGDRR
jgi:hypothetical protein